MHNKLESLKRSTIRLQRHDQKKNSKFGGLPSVESADFKWPTYSDNPLAFLGQIDLEEMGNVLSYGWLPPTGTLLFFYDIIEQCSGFDPEERGGWRVIYQEAPNSTAPYPADIDVESKIEEHFLIGSVDNRLPPHGDHIHIPTTEYTIEGKEEFNLLSYAKIDESEADNPYHQFGGYPTDPSFHCLKLDAQLGLNGLKVFFSCDLPSLTDERIAAVPDPGSCNELYASNDALPYKEGASDWELLLQIDTDPEVSDEFVFGDGHKLYFYVQKEKARKKNFQDCWLLAERLY